MADSLQCTRLQSLRWRLLRTVCVAALLGLALSGLMSYWQAQHEAEELMGRASGAVGQTAAGAGARQREPPRRSRDAPGDGAQQPRQSL
jgi:hypothetical protein